MVLAVLDAAIPASDGRQSGCATSSLDHSMYGTANRLHPYCVRLTEGKAGSSGFPGGFYGGAGQEEAFPLNGGG